MGMVQRLARVRVRADSSVSVILWFILKEMPDPSALNVLGL